MRRVEKMVTSSDLPLASRSDLQSDQGSIARAQAEPEKAQRNQKTVADQIIADVQRSHQQ